MAGELLDPVAQDLADDDARGYNYIVVRNGAVVQYILAEHYRDARSQVTEEGDLFLLCPKKAGEKWRGRGT